MANTALVGQGCQRLDKTGLFVIDFVAMHIHQNLILLRKIEDVVQTFDPVLPVNSKWGMAPITSAPSLRASSSNALPLG
jgi:hypothetical protein